MEFPDSWGVAVCVNARSDETSRTSLVQACHRTRTVCELGRGGTPVTVRGLPVRGVSAIARENGLSGRAGTDEVLPQCLCAGPSPESPGKSCEPVTALACWLKAASPSDLRAGLPVGHPHTTNHEQCVPSRRSPVALGSSRSSLFCCGCLSLVSNRRRPCRLECRPGGTGGSSSVRMRAQGNGYSPNEDGPCSGGVSAWNRDSVLFCEPDAGGADPAALILLGEVLLSQVLTLKEGRDAVRRA